MWVRVWCGVVWRKEVAAVPISRPRTGARAHTRTRLPQLQPTEGPRSLARLRHLSRTRQGHLVRQCPPRASLGQPHPRRGVMVAGLVNH